jgi:glutathione peroxidase
MPFTNLIAVRTFVNRVEAEIARSALEAAGIHAVIERDDCGGTRPSLWLAGVGLLVRPEDVETAAAVLSTPAIYATPSPTDTTTPDRVVFDFSVRAIDGALVPMSRFRGQVLLIVNVASQCGYTPQYAGLESLYRSYRDRGFAVLGFPCDQFGHQEPGTDNEIRQFCSDMFAVTFPMFSKIDVNGPRADPLFRFLKSQKRGWLGTSAIKWNFTKFLVGRDGDVLQRYGSNDTPSAIEPDVARAVASDDEALAR